MEVFNKEDVYDNEISPLMKEIIAICKKHEIPMISSFTFENCPERGPGRCTTFINENKDREDDANYKALKIIKGGGHETFTTMITTTKG